MLVLEPLHEQIVSRLNRCLPVDRQRISRLLREVRQPSRVEAVAANAGDPVAAILSELDAAEVRARQRLENPAVDPATIRFDAALPIVARRQEIADAIAANQVVIVCGETGSGKTTQLPKICLQSGRGVLGMIGHTQPRRIAARSVAARLASELGVKVGGLIGYSVRFTDRTRPETIVRVMTDGILLAETARDRLLLRYDTIIIDEAHERSLNIDFLLGYLKTLLPRRSDLKVIITSATIDTQRFSGHFGNAPIIEVSGRGYPVEIRFQPVPGDIEADEDDPVMLDAIHHAIQQTEDDAPGDALVFLSGEREIREAAKFLADKLAPDHEILPLYARLSSDEQNRVFEPHAGRRIVLATNVAETSLTVPGVRSVIDPGLARISRYSPVARVQRLPIERISQASAQQRAGRCGRVAPGICIRLYSEEEFASRPIFAEPEIQRSNLASVILQMKALRLGSIDEFPFIDRPRASSIRAGLQTLFELGAIDDRDQLTPIGRRLARMPIDPRFGRMILDAEKEHAVRETLVIVSALATQDPRLRPHDRSNLADASHAEFADERSDFLSFVNLWEWWQEASKEHSSSKMRRLCEARFISFVRMREWSDTHRQLHALAIAAGMRSNPVPARYDQIHRALLSGLLSNVGAKTDTHEYQGVSDRKFAIFPGSAMFKHQPRWVMAAEVVETTRLYARTVARIHPDWIESLAPHLIKRTYTAPYWNRGSAHVEAHERVMLRGLTIVPKRRVHYGRIDLPLARETFIQHALVEGDYQSPAARGQSRSASDDVLSANRALIASMRDFEHKARRRDVFIGPEAMFAFYDSRLPPNVCNGPSFEKWRRRAERRNPNVLRLQPNDVMRSGATLATADDFPTSISMGGMTFPLEYRHEPGHRDDGITMIVPAEALRQIADERCDWLVPGMLREKIAASIKALPKQWRTHFVPVPQYVDVVAANIAFGVGVLTDAIARELDRSTGVRVPRSACRADAIAHHLRMNFRIIDANGETLAVGRDLDVLRARVAATASDVHAASHAAPCDARFQRSGLTHWEFDDLPAMLAVPRAGIDVVLHSAIVDEGSTVGTQLLTCPDSARAAHRTGLRRLFVIAVGEELAMHVEYLPGIDQMLLHHAPLAAVNADADLKRDLIDLIADRVFLRDDPDIRTGEAFRQRLDAGWDQLWNTASAVADLVARILAACHDVHIRLEGASENAFLAPAVEDIRKQLGELLPARFLVNTPWRWLAELPRFLNAIVIRLQKLTNAGLERDRIAMHTIHPQWSRFVGRRARMQAIGEHILPPALDEYRWLIEELRVSLFAQELRTSVPVSSARLDKAWAAIS